MRNALTNNLGNILINNKLSNKNMNIKIVRNLRIRLNTTL